MSRPTERKRALAGLLTALALAATGGSAHAALPQQTGSVDLGAAAANPVLDGAGNSDLTGTVVADAGDVNGDGIEDLIVTAPYSDANGHRDSGTAYVVFGRTDGASLALSGIGSGAGFRIDGAAAGDRLGLAAAAAGDVNGDGLDDVVVGAPLADNRGRTNSGSAYVIFGRASSSAINVGSLGGAGFRVDGAGAGDRLGSSVSGGTDLNQDGRADVLAGAPLADRNARTNSGSVYAIFGKGGSDAEDAAALGGAGYEIDGAAPGDQLGAVAATPDLTGDGRSDVLAGARYADAAGRVDAGTAYVVAGRASSGTIDLSQPGTAAYSAYGATAGDQAGAAVAQGGDLNGDGRGDLLVGAPGTDYDARAGAGSAYVLLGAAAGGAHDLGSLDSAWRIDGAAPGDGLGMALSAGGDLNADGRADLVIGDQYSDAAGRTDDGSAWVLYGGAFGGVVDLAGPGHGFRAFGGGSYDWAGSSVAIVPDATGDGRADLVVGAARTDHLGHWDGGSAYVLYGFGQASLAYPQAAITTAGQPLPALAPSGVVRTGPVTYSIAPALPAGLVLDPKTGVLSGTPTDVLEAGLSFTLTMTDLSGSVSVPLSLRIAPRPGPCANARTGTKAADRIVGTSGGDKVSGGDGSDTEEGGSGEDCLFGDDDGDTLFGGTGSDQLHGGVGQDLLDGGTGDDQLFGENGNDKLTGDDGGDLLRGGLGFDELDGGGGNDRLYGEDQTDSLDGGAGNDRLEGGGGNDRIVGGAGNDVLAGGSGNDTLIDRSGSNRVDGGSGNDTIDVRNGKRDTVKCGRGRDRVSADRIDRLSGCERVKRSRRRGRRH